MDRCWCSEGAGEPQVVVVVDELVAKEHHLPLQQRCTDGGDLPLTQRGGEVHPGYLRPGPPGLRTNLDRLDHLCHRCFPFSRNVF